MTTEPWEDYYDNYYADNETESCDLKELHHAHWILPTLYSVFFVVGLIGNVMVIIVVSRRTSRRADVFILNLAVSDLAFVLTLPFWASSQAQGGNWPFGTFLCQASGFTIAVTRCASSHLMAIMSVDRYVAVIRGTKVHPLRTRRCSIGACCVIWTVSVLVGCPSLLTREINAKTSACVDSANTSLSLGFRIGVVFLTFVFPFAVVVFCYCRMAKYLWNHFGRQVNKGRPRSRHSWLRIVTCVVGTYCFSWLPFNTLNTLWLMGKLGADLPCSAWVAIHQALSPAAALAFANSCTNPLIYALLDVGFRRRAQLALPRLYLTCRSLLSTTSSTMPTTITSVESTSTYTGNR
ncbi:PREDICTED: probable G-protein coupled receptor 25 [Nanorana parkeri]|uniref:probable G-protein coupled receptor 25 n=1 Tax=Nanorana parkeri TaxID=125878 RepID=UPI0008544C2C|nr:PREDICTED: probable G-protein coupled receptor 25 [Nanorana parkeri]